LIKAGHLFLLRGKQQLEVHEALPGDICAIAKIDEIQFDHVLHDSPGDAQVHARPLELPTSVFGLAVQPKKRGDEQKVSDVLHKITAEDRRFRIEHNSQANETVMRGLGEMHLRTVLEKMSSQYKLDLDTRPPSIPYRETIAVRAEGHSRHKKQTGGAGQFGEVYLKVEPLPRGSGFEFVDSVKGGAIPNQFIPSVEKGVRSVLDTGYIAGFPLQDVRVIVYDGKSHPVDSKDVAFRARALSGPPQVAHRGPRLLQPRVQPLRAGAAAAAAEARRRAPAGRRRGLSRAVRHFSRGRGAPPLVFVHGFTCDHTDWRFQVSHFQTQRQVVACDLRGHGSTPGGPEDCTISHYGGDVAAMLAKLDLAKSILVGHSMGCRVVLEAARLDPDRVCAIVLIDGRR